MAKQKTLSIEGIDIRYYQKKKEDFISLTDIAKKFNERTGQLISNWLRTKSTVIFIGGWEVLHNEDFNVLKFEYIKNQTGSPTFVLSMSEWIKETNAIGIISKTGRYGGTFAHKDIAFEFLSYLSPVFRLYVAKEFQRLKEKEDKEKQEALHWTINRTLAKANYHIHTDAIKEYLVPLIEYNTKRQGIYFASEADLLNVALFGLTAKEWRIANPELKGNMRDYANAEQLLVLANIENLNAEFIKQGLDQESRLKRLNEIAIHQMSLLMNLPVIKKLKK